MDTNAEATLDESGRSVGRAGLGSSDELELEGALWMGTLSPWNPST